MKGTLYDVDPTKKITDEIPLAQKPVDVGQHYRHSMAVAITQADIEKGYVMVNMDPYRIAKIYALGGGAREHIVKKALRGTEKGHSERKLIDELRCCLDRWEQMLDEDELVTKAMQCGFVRGTGV